MLVSLLLIVSLFQVSHGQALTCSGECRLIFGGGTIAVADMIQQWGLFYKIARSSVNVDYSFSDGRRNGSTVIDAIDAIETIDALQEQCLKPDEPGYNDMCFHNHNFLYDYAVLDHNPSYYLPQSKLDTVVLAPLYTVGVGLAYRLTNFSKVNPLYLSRDLIFKIFSFQITNWADPQIVNFNRLYNQNAVFPNASIKVVIRADETGLTRTMNQFLQSVDSSWPGNCSLTWPVNLTGKPNVFREAGAFDSTDRIALTANSIGYIPMNFAVVANLSYAIIQNKRGSNVWPTTKTLQAAVEALKTSDGEEVDSDAADAYPLPLTSYLVITKQATHDCALRTEMHKFWHWALTDTLAVAHARANLGFADLPTVVVDRVKNLLYATTCQGYQTLADSFSESSTTPTRLICIVICAICMALTISVFGALAWKRENRITKATGLIFAGVFLTGCFFNYLGVILWALIPYTTTICNTRSAIVIVGTSLCAIAIFTKSWMIFNFWSHVPKKEDSLHFVEVSTRTFSFNATILIVFQLLLLILWYTTSEVHFDTKLVQAIDRVFIHYCTTDKSIWIYIEGAFLGSFVLWTIYLAYATRGFWSKLQFPNESQNILSSILNAFFWVLVLLPMLVILQGNPETTFFLTAMALFFPTSFAIVSIFVPKLLFIFDANPDIIANFLAGIPQAPAGYNRPPASSIDVSDNDKKSASEPKKMEIPDAIPDLPTEEEKEAKKDSPLVWYRQLDSSSVSQIGSVTAPESSIDSPSVSTQSSSATGPFFREAQIVASPSLELVRHPSSIPEE